VEEIYLNSWNKKKILRCIKRDCVQYSWS